MSFNEELKTILRETGLTKKDVANWLELSKSTFQYLTVNNKLQPKQQKAVMEAIAERKRVVFPPYEYECITCFKTFESIRIQTGYRCQCESCRIDKKPLEKVRKHKKPNLSINEILRIGKENGVHGYGRIVQMIERGELDVLSKK